MLPLDEVERPPILSDEAQQQALQHAGAVQSGNPNASYACQHLHGGVGIDVDYPLHRHFKWAIQIEHELGSAKNHLERLGDRLAAGEVATF